MQGLWACMRRFLQEASYQVKTEWLSRMTSFLLIELTAVVPQLFYHPRKTPRPVNNGKEKQSKKVPYVKGACMMPGSKDYNHRLLQERAT